MADQSAAHSLGTLSMSLRSDDDVAVVTDILRHLEGSASDDRARTLSAEQHRALRRHRLHPLIPDHWSVEGANTDPAAQRRRLARRSLRWRAALVEVLASIDAAGIEARVLKGSATSLLDYDHAWQRTYVDLDILVRPDDFTRAAECLAEFSVPRTAPPNEFEKGQALVTETGFEVDLHSRVSGYSAQSPEVLFARPEPIPATIGLALPVEARLVHAAAHLLYTPIGHRLLSGLADITAIRSRHGPDLAAVRAFAAATGMEAVAGEALRIEGRFMDRDPTEFDDWTPLTRLERYAFAGTERHLVFERLVAARSVEGVAGKLRYLSTMAIPNRERAALSGGRKEYLRRALPRRLGGQNLSNRR